jgi:uncharacterized membrane protein
MSDSKVTGSTLAPDEIDLIGVLVKTIRFFKINGAILLISTAIGAAIGFFVYTTKDKMQEQ